MVKSFYDLKTQDSRKVEPKSGKNINLPFGHLKILPIGDSPKEKLISAIVLAKISILANSAKNRHKSVLFVGMF